MAVQVVVSLLGDRDDLPPRQPAPQLAPAPRARRSLRRDAVAPAARTTTGPTSTPTTATPTELVEQWRDRAVRRGRARSTTSSPTRPGRRLTTWSTSTSSIVGAGLSGIGAGPLRADQVPVGDATPIFEARDAIGGTWDLFRYPGIRSDSDMFTLGYSFRPWDGEKAIADGASILQYIKDTAAEAGIDEHIRFNHRIVARRLVDRRRPLARHRRAHRHRRDGRAHVRLRVLLQRLLPLRPRLPARLRRAWTASTGTIVHPQAWPEDLDYAGKRVVVIGSGATAVTLDPVDGRDGRARDDAAAVAHATSRRCRRRTRSPTCCAGCCPTAWSGPVDPVVQGARRRRRSYQLSRRRPELDEAHAAQGGVERQLPDGLRHRHPLHADATTRGTSGCASCPTATCSRRSAPARASVVTDHIDTFTETGIRLESGAELEADIIVTATGLELLFIGGIELSVDGEKVDLAEQLTYKGMMLEGVPNLAMAVGYTNASWTLKCDLTCDYVDPPAQPHARRPACGSARRSTATRRSPRRRCSA